MHESMVVGLGPTSHTAQRVRELNRRSRGRDGQRGHPRTSSIDSLLALGLCNVGFGIVGAVMFLVGRMIRVRLSAGARVRSRGCRSRRDTVGFIYQYLLVVPFDSIDWIGLDWIGLDWIGENNALNRFDRSLLVFEPGMKVLDHVDVVQFGQRSNLSQHRIDKVRIELEVRKVNLLDGCCTRGLTVNMRERHCEPVSIG